MQRFVYAKKCIVPSTAANVLQSLHMAAAFGQAGADVTFFPGVRGKGQQERSRSMDETLRAMGIDGEQTQNAWHLLPGNHAGVYGLRFRLAMLAELVRSGNTLFYARDIAEALFVCRASALTGRRCKLVFEMHEVLHLQRQNAAKADRLRRAEQSILRKAAGVVVINPVLEGAVRDIFGYTNPVLVAPSAYNPAIFKPVTLFTPERPWPEADAILQLVYLGRFHEGKGVENVIAALAFLPERVHLRVIGSGASLEKLQAQAASLPGGKERVVFTGMLPQKEAAAACDGAHIFVIPQESGGMFFSPLKLYEAMGLGLPILATPLDIFAEQEKQEILATAPGVGSEDLAKGIMDLAVNPARALTLRTNALAEAKNATWEARARRILAFCETLA